MKRPKNLTFKSKMAVSFGFSHRIRIFVLFEKLVVYVYTASKVFESSDTTKPAIFSLVNPVPRLLLAIHAVHWNEFQRIFIRRKALTLYAERPIPKNSSFSTECMLCAWDASQTQANVQDWLGIFKGGGDKLRCTVLCLNALRIPTTNKITFPKQLQTIKAVHIDEEQAQMSTVYRLCVNSIHTKANKLSGRVHKSFEWDDDAYSRNVHSNGYNVWP